MTASPSLPMLYARLQLTLPAARSVLVAPPRSSVQAIPVARELAGLAATAGCSVRLIELSTSGEQDQVPPGPQVAGETSDREIEVLSLPAARLANMDRLREALAPARDLTVIAAGGLLDSPVSILAAAIVDGVVVVVCPGKTARLDLHRVKLEVERAGGRIAGAVMLK